MLGAALFIILFFGGLAAGILTTAKGLVYKNNKTTLIGILILFGWIAVIAITALIVT